MPNSVAFVDNSHLARNKTPKPRITPRVKRAIDAIVHDAKSWNEAAAETGLSMRTMRLAFERPHVMSYYRQQCQVLRASTTAHSIHRLREIGDAADNMPAVNAIRALEQLGDEQITKPNVATPGISIRIVNVAQPPPPMDIKAAPRVLDAEPD
jgi:hypothetical protein